MVAMIAAFTVWMCLSTIGAAVEFERKRRSLGQEVQDLRDRYSLSFPCVIISPKTMAKPGSGSKAA